MEQLAELLALIQAAFAQHGPIAAIGAGLMVLLRIFRLPFLQGLLPAKAQWAAWPLWLKWVAPFALGFVGTLISGLAAKLALGSVVVAAVTSGVGAILLHHGTKFVGEAVLPPQTPASQNPLKQALGLIVPFPKSKQAPML